MNRIRIDFAPPSLSRSLLRTGLWTWLLFVMGVTLCLVAALNVNALTAKIAAVDEETRSFETKLSERAAAQPVSKKITINEGQANAVNTAIAQLNLPWRDIFDAIEAATPATVALLALDPDAEKHIVKGLAEAKSSDEMIDYIARLKRQSFLQDVVLLKHEVNEQDSNRPLRFQFEAHWTEIVQ